MTVDRCIQVEHFATSLTENRSVCVGFDVCVVARDDTHEEREALL
jgi:hypothetical protein